MSNVKTSVRSKAAFKKSLLKMKKRIKYIERHFKQLKDTDSECMDDFEKYLQSASDCGLVELHEQLVLHGNDVLNGIERINDFGLDISVLETYLENAFHVEIIVDFLKSRK